MQVTFDLISGFLPEATCYLCAVNGLRILLHGALVWDQVAVMGGSAADVGTWCCDRWRLPC